MKVFLFIFLGTCASYFGYFHYYDPHADLTFGINWKEEHKYYYKNIELNAENLKLKNQLTELEFKLNKTVSEQQYTNYKLRSGNKSEKRIPANVPSRTNPFDKDLVQQKIYKWSAEKLFEVGKSEYQLGKFEKSAQFFHTLVQEYPESKLITDEVMFYAAMAAFKTKNYYQLSESYFARLITTYPESDYFIQAKLWRALSLYHLGDEKEFKIVLNELKSKYRNTTEWKMMSKYYGKIAEKYSL